MAAIFGWLSDASTIDSPAPRGDRISYGPSRVPADGATCCVARGGGAYCRVKFTLQGAGAGSEDRAREHGRLRAVRGERIANNLLVVARVDVRVGVRRMYPVDVRQLAPVFGRRGRLDHLRAADLLVPFRTEPRDHELAAIVVDEVAVALTDDETRDPTPSLPGDVLRFPDALAVLRPDATKLTVAADAVDV